MEEKNRQKANTEKRRTQKQNEIIKNNKTTKQNEIIKKNKTIKQNEKVKLNKTTKQNENKKQSGICEYAKKCGGCTFQGIAYEKQLEKKQRTVQMLCKDICKVEKIEGMDKPYHYRNKVHAVFARKKDGTIVSGVYEEGTHRVVPVDACQIEDEIADQIIYDIRNLLKSFRITIYNEKSGYGLLRHVLVRRGFTSGEVMVVLVITNPIFPSKNNFVKALRKLHPEISTVVLNVNDKDTTMVLGSRDIVIYGKGYITDTLCDCKFKLSPQSFYQINPVQTTKLYYKAMELAELDQSKKVIDAYCGIGTIGLIAAKRAKEVIGVELNKEAVKDAIANAKMNEMKNAKFYADDAGEFMLEMAQKGEKADVVFMDPPRSGSTETFLKAAATLAPEKIVYISCNPETMVRDIRFLKKKGYEPHEVYPFDMFPHTGHVEAVCLLSKKQ